MIYFLRKHKLEKILYNKKNSFLIIHIIPVKEVFLINWVSILAKYNILAKYLKTKQSGGILKSIINKKNNKSLNFIFKNSIIYLYINSTKPGLLLNQFMLFLEKEKKLFINNNKKFNLLSVFIENEFYHSKTALEFIKKKPEKKDIIIKLDLVLIQTFENLEYNIILLIKLLSYKNANI